MNGAVAKMLDHLKARNWTSSALFAENSFTSSFGLIRPSLPLTSCRQPTGAGRHSGLNPSVIPSSFHMLLRLQDIRFENISNTSDILVVEENPFVAGLAQQSAQAFLARRQTIRTLLATGDRAAVEIDDEATVAQDLPNGLKAGQQLTLRGGKISFISDF